MNPITNRTQPEDNSKSSAFSKETMVLVYPIITIPGDRKWAWVILAAAFFITAISESFPSTYSLFVNEVRNNFRLTTMLTCLANSLLSGLSWMMSPVVCAFINRHGLRNTAVLGGVIGCISVYLSVIMVNAWLFFIMYSIIASLATAMMRASSGMICGYYFFKWRFVSFMIMTCSERFSCIVFPAFFEGISSLDLGSKFKVLALLCFICSLLGFTFTPIPSQKFSFAQDDMNYDNIPKVSSQSSESIENYYHNMRFIDRKCTAKNSNYPTASDIVDYSSNRAPKVSSEMFLQASEMSRNTLAGGVRMSYNKKTMKPIIGCCPRKSNRCHKICPRLYPSAISRPMYRDDIFYTYDVKRAKFLEENKCDYTDSRLKFHAAVSRVATARDLEEDKYYCVLCATSVKRALATMLDFSLLKSPSFRLILASYFLYFLAYFTPLVFLNKFAKERELDKKYTYYLLTSFGVFHCIGTMTWGALSSLCKVWPLLIIYMSIILCGTVTLIFHFIQDIVVENVFVGLYGLTSAAYPTLKSVLLVEVLGIEKLTNAYGLMMFTKGIAILFGLPISGFIRDWTGSYTCCFLVCGTIFILSGLILIPLHRVSTAEKTRREETAEQIGQSSRGIIIF